MGVHVLVVDDSTTIQKVIRIAFSRLEVSITSASSLIEALSEIHNKRPQVILADASLNGVRSVADFNKLSAEADQAPVILLVGSYDAVDEVALKEQGFPHIVHKPFESSDIIRKVGEVLGLDLENPGSMATAPRMGAETLQTTTTISSENPRDTHILPPPPNGMSAAHAMQGLAEKTIAEAEKGSFSKAQSDVLPHLPGETAGTEIMQSVDATMQSAHDDSGITFSLEPQSHAPISAAAKPISQAEQNLTDDASSTRKGHKAFEQQSEKAVRKSFQAPPPPPAEEEFALDHDVLAERSRAAKSREVEAVTNSLRLDTSSSNTAAPQPTPVVHEAEKIPAVSYKPSIDEIRVILDAELRELIAVHIREAVEEYCAKQFAQVARDIISSEIRRLTEERARHLVDN